MPFGNRLLAAQLSSAWKQRSYPGLCAAMLGALQVFTRTTKNLQAETQTLRRPLRFAEQLHQFFFHMRWLSLLFKIVLPDTRAGVIFR